jgi:pimeloyl-ACP methyl ester carboxylesterase
VKLNEKALKFRGMDFYYWTLGNPENASIVLLHPAFADHNIFIRQFDEFGKGFFIIAVDLIGHGRNQKGKSKVTMGDLPEIISKILIVEGAGKCHVVGVSMGSLVAQGFADKYPDKILSVTIVGGYSIHKDNGNIRKEQGKEMLKWLGYVLFSMKRFRNYIVDISVNSDEGKAVFMDGVLKFRRSSFLGMQGMDRIFRRTDDPVRYPMLIVCGEYDSSLAKNAGKSLSASESSSNYIEINDAGHCANIDNPVEFNKVLSTFLNTASLSGAG